ncbi:LmbU family transcriptional regulator [Microbispora sp. KK1-11]|uniref:LmbU family transcriptional regulator n=1 Tax=Microbispora sp. KK1-11 TaxID=2053005 RepID=UPI00115C36B5|nr:LmbU family transcriptional regulator [Microbispora sp. KK1-11]TQS19112.1 hypothetical protein FLW16_42035 [Microbispora sp. KK1-11]
MNGDEPRSEDSQRLPLGRAVLTRRTSLSLPQRMSLEDWKRVGRQISHINDASTWWLGDWLVYGRECFPDRYKRAVEDTALDYQTLRNYAWVAGRFSRQRRRARLSFQHHAEVAVFSEHIQDMWLDRAEENGWSRNALRTHIRAVRDQPRSEATKAVQVAVDVAPDQLRLWEEAARRTRWNLVDWMVHSLNKAAGSADLAEAE